MAAKPTEDPKWVTTDDPQHIIEPTAALKLNGVGSGSVWGREHLNWMFNANSKWIDWVRSDALGKDNSLSELTNKPQSFDNIKQDATESYKGVVELATSSEVIAGTDNTRVITPSSLSALTANTSRAGLIATATNAETQALTSTTKAVTPSSLFSCTATNTRRGVVELATGAETATGTDTTRAITPAGLLSRTATTDRAGVVELATTAETTSGTDSTRAVTPQGLSQLSSTADRRGLIELATDAEVITGTDTARAVTPKSLHNFLDSKFYSVVVDAASLGAASWADTNIPSGVRRVVFAASGLVSDTSGEVYIRLGDNSSYTSDYVSRRTTNVDTDAIGTTTSDTVNNFKLSVGNVFGSPAKDIKVVMDLVDEANGVWMISSEMHAGSANAGTFTHAIGRATLGAGKELQRFLFVHDTLNFTDGEFYLTAS